jgi:hypothetical protein
MLKNMFPKYVIVLAQKWMDGREFGAKLGEKSPRNRS